MAGRRLWLVLWFSSHLATILVFGEWVVDAKTQLDSSTWPGSSWIKQKSNNNQKHSVWDTRNGLPMTQKVKNKNGEKVMKYNSSNLASAIIKKRKSGTVIFKSRKDNEQISSRSIVKNRDGQIKLNLSPDQLGTGMGGSIVKDIKPSDFQKFANEPAPQTAVLGSIVVLPCRVINKVGHLQWTKDGFGLGNERNLFGFSRYSMIGSDDEGDFSLRINPVSLNDDGFFQCQVSASNGVPGIRSKSVHLTVHVPPDPPVIEPSELRTTAGVLTTITCQSKGGRPPPEIQWIDNNHPRESLRLGAVTKTDQMKDNKRSIVTSTLTFTPRRSHDNGSLTCTTSNPALSSPQLTHVPIRVLYPPDVDVKVNPPRLVEGDDAVFVCNSESNPSNVSYRWYHNSAILTNQSTQSLTLPHIKRELHKDSISCEVSNEVGTSKKSVTIQIRYGPVFKTPPSDAAEVMGSEVHLKCNVDANPPASVVWLREGADKIIGSGPELRVTVSANTAGSYLCVAGVRDRDLQFPELTGKMQVFVKGKPVIVSPSIQSGRPGSTVNVECNTVSVPSPIQMTWYHKGRIIELEDPRYEILEEQRKEGTKSILRIHKASVSDFGDYNCSVVNEFGIDRKLIRLDEERRVPMLLLIGGVGSLLIVIVMVTSLVLCNKRNAREKVRKLFGCSSGFKRRNSVVNSQFHSRKNLEFSRGSPVPDKLVTPSGPPNMYSVASDNKILESGSNSTSNNNHQNEVSAPNSTPENGNVNSHPIETNRGSVRTRDPFDSDRTSTFNSTTGREEEHGVYLPLMELSEQEMLIRRGSVGEMQRENGHQYRDSGSIIGPQSDPHLAPDFCTLRRGARGPDITLGYADNTEIRITDNRAHIDSLPNGNGMKRSGLGNRYSSYSSSYSASPPPPPYPHQRAPLSPKPPTYGRPVPPQHHPQHSGSGSPITRVGVNGSPMISRTPNGTNYSNSSLNRDSLRRQQQHDSDYIFSNDAILKPGTLV